MHQMTIQYRGGFRTEAVHLDSQNKIITDAPKDNQGQGQAFSPTDLMCTSLASCVLTIMAMKAKALGIDYPEVSAEIEKKMQANPRKVAEIVLRFDWKGLDQKCSPEQMKELKEAGMNCPVFLSLDSSVKKTLHW